MTTCAGTRVDGGRLETGNLAFETPLLLFRGIDRRSVPAHLDPVDPEGMQLPLHVLHERSYALTAMLAVPLTLAITSSSPMHTMKGVHVFYYIVHNRLSS